METMRKMRLVEGLAFVRAEHSATGVSSSYSLLLDLRLLNWTMVSTHKALQSREPTDFRL